MSRLLPDRALREVTRSRRGGIDAEAMATAAAIVSQVESGGAAALESLTAQFEERPHGLPLFLTPNDLSQAAGSIPGADLKRLEKTAGRIERFALAQRQALKGLDGVEVAGGRAGHTVVPVERAGCYAPGGRYPLPSSVLMTAVTARAAGVPEVWVASPRPAPITLAAAAVAGADGMLVAGGAHAIAALALGAGTASTLRHGGGAGQSLCDCRQTDRVRESRDRHAGGPLGTSGAGRFDGRSRGGRGP